MKAVWSFWTKPYLAERRSSWYTDWHHWLGWGLSVHAARQHYPETCLVTDDEGARILVDALQLPFEHVSTELNALQEEDPEWWALGKIAAYRRQSGPFVHVDADVFLWSPLASELEQADVFAQNPEPIVPGASCYRPEEFEQVIGGRTKGWLPKEWISYSDATAPTAACCGIFGGCRVDFIQHYADSAFKLVTDARNRDALQAVRGKGGYMILVEQYLLNACIEYHRRRNRSPYRQIEISYLFDSMEEAFQPHRAAQAGYTHLASDAKRNGQTCHYLERRVQRCLPQHYERCVNFVQNAYGPGRSAANTVHLSGSAGMV
jgi:hypothetical protein